MAKDYLIDYYKKAFKEILFPLGFKLKGRRFYKVVNGEVLQGVSIEKHRLIRAFTINFQFGVLCNGIDARFLRETRVNGFLYGKDIWWDFDINDIDSIKHKINYARDEFKRCLNLFSTTVDTQTYLDTSCYIDKQAYNDIIYDEGKVYVCLKLKKYDLVLKCIDNIEKDRKEWLDQKLSICKMEHNNEEEKFIRIAEEHFFEYKNIREAILKEDFAYIDNVINQNEEISKQSIKDYFKIEL